METKNEDIDQLSNSNLSADLSKVKTILSAEEIKEAHELALKYFKKGNFDEAEQEITNVLHSVLNKTYVNLHDSFESILSSMYHLGLIYLQNPNNTYSYPHAKAAAIFQYCAQFSNKHNITLSLSEGEIANQEYFISQSFSVEKQFLAEVGVNIPTEDFNKKITEYKNELETLRKTIKEQLTWIDALTIEDIGFRADIVERIYDNSNKFFVNHPDPNKPGLVQRLLTDCYQQLGKPPSDCQYTILGLGSLATGGMTPWSDLEFAILINEDEAEYKEYFRNLTKLLWIKVINFGETPLSAVGIECLNDYKTGEESDNWFKDNIIEKAFRFDPVYEDACKSPLGRQGRYKVKQKIIDEKTGLEITQVIEKPDYELIFTKEQMLAFQQEKVKELEERKAYGQIKNWFESDRHLSQALQTVSLIEGSQTLLDEYRQDLSETDPAIQKARALQLLQEDLKGFSLELGDEAEGKLFDAKQTIYRLGDRIVNALANYYNIIAKEGEKQITIWQMIKKMQTEGIINAEGEGHLLEAISISTELRIRTYSDNEGRYDNMSISIPAVGHLDEKQRKLLVEKTFYIKDTSILHHFYYVMMKVQTILEDFCNTEDHDEAEVKLKNDNLFVDNDFAKGIVHARFLEYDMALEFLKKESELALEYLNESIHHGRLNARGLAVFQALIFLCKKTGDRENLFKYSKMILDLKQDSGLDPNDPSMACSYNNLGIAYNSQGKYDEDISELNKALTIWSKNTPSFFNYLNMATTHNNLGEAYNSKSFYDKAIEQYEKVLDIYKLIYVNNPNHRDIGMIYNKLGVAYLNKKFFVEKATECFNKSLDIMLKYYKNIPNHPDIATCYKNLGEAYLSNHSIDNAISEYKKALEIYESCYASTPNNPYIADIYNRLGFIYLNKGLCDQAIKEFNKALDIYKLVCPSVHPSIAQTYHDLGLVYFKKKSYDKAVENFEKALIIMLEVDKSTAEHPDLATFHSSLADAYGKSELYDNAIKHYRAALKIFESSHNCSANFSNIADIYGKLGLILIQKKSYDEAIDKFERALEIYKLVHAGIYHSDIAIIHSNLGNAYGLKGSNDEAIYELQKALTIYESADDTLCNQSNIQITHNNLQDIYISKDLYNGAIEDEEDDTLDSSNIQKLIDLQCGNNSFLSGDLEKAKEYYQHVHPSLPNMDFFSQGFVCIQKNIIAISHKNNFLPLAISCQKVLIKIDQELNYGSHHRDLACLFACQGNIEEANQAFINTEVSSGLYTEYAQLLILNKDSKVLNIDKNIITECLYKAISCNNVRGLSYRSIEKKTVCDILLNLIKAKNTTIKVNPKILAYYLLITNPEYIREEDNVENLITSLNTLCNIVHDEVSFKILADSCGSIGNDELSIKYNEYSKTIGELEDLIAGRALLEANKDILNLTIIQEITDNYTKLAYQTLSTEMIENSIKFFTKLFQIYEKKIVNNPDEFQKVVNSLASLYLITENRQEYFILKSRHHSELDLRTLELLNLDIVRIQSLEYNIIWQIMESLNQNKEVNSTPESSLSGEIEEMNEYSILP